MNAVVLVGGQGTRLRPLTETLKKELLPLVDRAILDRTLDRLTKHGVDHVVMSSPYLEEAFAPFIRDRRGDPNITWVTETEALDTGGAIVNSRAHIGMEPFFALNGDILTALDMTAMWGFHEERRAAVTIALHRVEDARAFGLVATDADGRITEFQEKPADRVGGDINAGTYILDPAVLGAWNADRPISIEREIFPSLIADDQPVYGFVTDAYWMDLGTPEKYLTATFDILDGRLDDVSYPSPWIHSDAAVDLRAHLGRHVVVSAGVRVGPSAEVDESVLLASSEIGEGARVVGSIAGPGSQIGPGATVVGSVLGEGASVPPGLAVEAAKVSPFTSLRG
jgi:mannose-1-phosphate guanylyltransferase